MYDTGNTTYKKKKIDQFNFIKIKNFYSAKYS